MIINELWNTRSSISKFFDLLETPIAIYEYRKGKTELLRTNIRYEADVVFDKEVDEREHYRRAEAEKALLSEAFARIVRGDFSEALEYELTEDVWYRLTIKMIGKRADTMIMMVTFYEISIYK